MATSGAIGARQFIIARRGAGIANLQEVSIASGDYTLEQAEVAGVYKVNCTHQVGIATSTEVGLTADRYPIRIILTGNANSVPFPKAEVVAGYWRVTTANNVGLVFVRKPMTSERALRNLFAYYADLNDVLWRAYGDLRAAPYNHTHNATVNDLNDKLFAILDVENPTDVQIAEVVPLVTEIITVCTETATIPYFRVAQNVYVRAEPHGKKYTAINHYSENKMAITETALCAKINFERLKRRYPDLNDGIVTLASYSVAAMFRHGFQETFEHQEYYTVVMAPVAGSAGAYSVTRIIKPAGAPDVSDIAVGRQVNISDVKFKKQFVELSNLMVVISGLMHYLFNHTTGGVMAAGALLTVMSMYQFISKDSSEEDTIVSTSLLYEALHPTNKRGIANIFFKTSGVTTHGRCITAPMYERFELDSFTQIRANPYPAGSHKAFMCLMALRRVIQSGMAPFLPWAEQMANCIQSCKTILNNGARSHIGSNYYTGEPPIAQPTNLDNYLPELAMYVHTFNKGDSLTFSPHLSVETSRKAAMNWQNLMREMKAKDVSATSTDIVRKFLTTSGSVHFSFDPNDETTWAKAIQDSKLADRSISEMFL